MDEEELEESERLNPNTPVVTDKDQNPEDPNEYLLGDKEIDFNYNEEDEMEEYYEDNKS